MNETAAPPNALLDEADVLRAADTWQIDGFSVWDTVKVQIAAETPEPTPFRADVLTRALYETGLPEADPNDALFALIRQLQNEVALLRREVETLRRQQTAPPPPPRPVAPPLHRNYSAPLFPLTTPDE